MFMQISIKIVLSALLLTFSLGLTAQTLHSIVVMDDSDTKIGAVVDGPYLVETFKNMASEAGMTSNSLLFKKSELSSNPEKITSAVNNLSCGSDDAVVFYYTGHGLNPENGSLFSAFVVNSTRFTMDWVEKKIQAKNPRLYLVVYDACNYSTNPNFTAGMDYAARTNPLLKQQNYQKLFKKAKGFVKIASNTAGYNLWSYGNRTNGGIFTRAFIASIETAVMSNDEFATWENIVRASTDKTKSQTAQMKDDNGSPQPQQVPYALLKLEYPRTSTGPLRNTPQIVVNPQALKDPD